ncbi:antitermination regulator [Streptomyces alboflavus]|uniref:Antitermination regulator n=1 Tax=Streptomyces alboflavus TaxID=67267 RepID=A0A1Z1WRT6_9ACTN|nr:antitermination regulator [Streptomyces alboflavus]
MQVLEHGMLRLERHTGLSREFTDFFAFVQDSTTFVRPGRRGGAAVTVKDVAVAEIFDEDSRRHHPAGGQPRLPQRSPDGAGRCGARHGLLAPRTPPARLHPCAAHELEAVGEQVGHWLAWHRGTRVLDALEHLHTAAAALR